MSDPFSGRCVLLKFADATFRVPLNRSLLSLVVLQLFVFVFGIPFAVGQEQANANRIFEWPNIRGPQWDGRSTETGLADTWPSEGPPVLWTLELGQGYSAFVAWEDSVATQYQTLGGQYVVCLDAKTGHIRWRHRYAWPYEPAGVYPGPRSTPVYADGKVFFTSPSGIVGCLDSKSGDLLWSVDLYAKFSSKPPGFGYACSPIIVGKRIVLPVGGRGASIVALNKADGSIAWQAGDDDASYASVLPIHFRGRALILGYMQNALVCHDATSGELVWRRPLSSGYDEHSAWPIYREPYVWIASPFQSGSELLELTDDATQPIKTVRRSKLMSNDIFSSVLHEGAIYGFDLHEAQAKTHRTSRGVFRCIDFETGESLWSVGTGRTDRSQRTDASSDTASAGAKAREPLVGHSTVLVADAKLILMNDLGELILARVSRDGYQELSRVQLLSGEICWTQPCLANGRLFVRNHSRAACVLLSDLASIDARTLASAKSVEDIPQSAYRDWAGVLLSIEPEYLFDLPSLEWLTSWYAISMFGIFGPAMILVGILRWWIPGSQFRETKTSTFAVWERVTYWTLCFVLGSIGTTFLSRWFDSFIFTWPVCLYTAWHVAIGHLELRYVELTWRKRIVAALSGAFWLCVCIGYFLLCRRLSLLFEWAFLAGFLAALPFNIVGAHWFANRSFTFVWRILMGALAFSAFYWSSVGYLLLRYESGLF